MNEGWVSGQQHSFQNEPFQKNSFGKINITFASFFFFLPPEISSQKSVCRGFLIQIGLMWTLELSWSVSSFTLDVGTTVPWELACTRQISSQINSTISAGWPLQKVGNNGNKAEILRNLNHCPGPVQKECKKRAFNSCMCSVFRKRQTPQWFFKLCRTPFILKATEENVKQQ